MVFLLFFLPVHPLERLVSNAFDTTFWGLGSTNSISSSLRSKKSSGGYDVIVRSTNESKGLGFDVEMIVDDKYTVESLDALKNFRVENCKNDEGKLFLTFRNRSRDAELEYSFLNDGRVLMDLSSMTSLSDLKQKLNDTVNLVLPEYGRGVLVGGVYLSHSTTAGLKTYFPMKMSRDDFLKQFMDSMHKSYHEIVELSNKINSETIASLRATAGVDFVREDVDENMLLEDVDKDISF